MNGESRDPTVILSDTVGDTGITTNIELLLGTADSGLPGQLTSPHLAAFTGIVVLALLGGILLIRKRLEGRSTLGTDRDRGPDEFVTDRERVRRLIEDNGGRMKQSRIVDSVDWSKAKVSRLLADLEDDGQVTKLRLGRENLVCLPGHEPTATRSREQPQSGAGSGSGTSVQSRSHSQSQSNPD